MKKMILTVSLILSMTFSAQARTVTERIRMAVQILGETAEESQSYKVKPNRDPKVMLLELALKEKLVESEEDFEGNWVGDSGDAWGADSMNWGVDSLAGAESYVTGALSQRLEEGEQTDKDKIQYADGMQKSKKAFTILRSIRSVKFGVVPMGAVQCGVTLPSLVIIDTEGGEIHQISMEGSGC